MTVLLSGKKTTGKDALTEHFIIRLAVLEIASQSRIVPSAAEVDAMTVPSGENVTESISPICPSRTCCTSHSGLIPLTFLINDSLSFQCFRLISLDAGLNTSAEPYICNGARSMIDP